MIVSIPQNCIWPDSVPSCVETQQKVPQPPSNDLASSSFGQWVEATPASSVGDRGSWQNGVRWQGGERRSQGQGVVDGFLVIDPDVDHFRKFSFNFLQLTKGIISKLGSWAYNICYSYLLKGYSDCKQNGTKNEPLSAPDFHILSHGVIRFYWEFQLATKLKAFDWLLKKYQWPG